jgi:hypothetical protein
MCHFSGVLQNNGGGPAKALEHTTLHRTCWTLGSNGSHKRLVLIHEMNASSIICQTSAHQPKGAKHQHMITSMIPFMQ